MDQSVFTHPQGFYGWQKSKKFQGKTNQQYLIMHYVVKNNSDIY